MAADERDDFEKLYRQHVDSVLAYALARTGRELAVEAVEATFLVAWQRINDVPDNARAWLLGVARRVLADQRRADTRRAALGVRIMAMRAGESPAADPANEVVERDHVLAALGRLPDADREVLGLLSWDGLSHDEAAQVLECSRTALKVRLHRARRRLAALLDDDNDARTSVDCDAGIAPPFTAYQPLFTKETLS